MKFKKLPPKELLWELFSYNPLTGELIRIKRQGPRGPVGQVVGVTNRCYLSVGIKGKQYFLHRVIYKWVTGEDPPESVDHRDRNTLNNTWINLRAVSWSLQRRNQQDREKTNGLPKGVTWFKHKQCYLAKIKHKGKVKHLGFCDTPEEAKVLYDKARTELIKREGWDLT